MLANFWFTLWTHPAKRRRASGSTVLANGLIWWFQCSKFVWTSLQYGTFHKSTAATSSDAIFVPKEHKGEHKVKGNVYSYSGQSSSSIFLRKCKPHIS